MAYILGKASALIMQIREENGGDNVKADLGTATWQCARALARMYFDTSNSDVLAKPIERYWKHGVLGSAVSANVQKDKGWKRIEEIKAIHPELDLSLKRDAVRWIRFGFLLQRRGVSFSDRFLKRYAQWRRESSTHFGGTTVQWRTRHVCRNGDSEVLEYPLDYFLHAPDLDENIISEINVELFDDRVEGETGAKKRKETTADHVGQHAQRLIGERIEEAARGAKIGGLTATKDKGRYVCHLTRLELAQKLRTKFSNMRQFSASTIMRAVGDFAACSRPRP